MVCSMKAYLINSLTSPWVHGFCSYFHIIIPAQVASSLGGGIDCCVKSPVWWQIARKKQIKNQNPGRLPLDASSPCCSSNVLHHWLLLFYCPHPSLCIVCVCPLCYKPRMLSSTAQPQWNLLSRVLQARLQRNWTDNPGYGTSWKASSYWCVAVSNRQLLLKGQESVKYELSDRIIVEDTWTFTCMRSNGGAAVGCVLM